MIALLASAFAASWSVAVPLPTVLVDGGVEQPAGVAFRVEGIRDGVPIVRERTGGEVDVVQVDGGWLIPAPDRSRVLSVLVEHPAAVRFRRSDGDTELSAWLAWDADLWHALRQGGAIPETPAGSTRDRAAIALRAAAIPDRNLVWLGALADTMADRPWGRVTHIPGVEAPLGPSGQTTVRGPGFAIVRVILPPGALTRFRIEPTLDGHTTASVPVASTGSAPLSTRVWVPPGVHTLSVVTPGATPSSVTVQPLRLRATLLRPVRTPAGLDGIELAEWLWLQGERDGARVAFRPFRDTQGPVGELARARLLASATDPAEALALAAAPPAPSADGYELLADAALQVADLLPPEIVLARIRTARDPDLVLVARWLDTLGGTRPRGLALLQAAATASPEQGNWGGKALREAGLVSRWSRLAPAEGSIVKTARYADRAPGIARVRAEAGDTLRIDLPVVPRGRFPVLRMRAEGYVAWTLDGAERRSPGGQLDTAFPPGAHELRIVSGTAILADPEVVAEGGTPVWEWSLAALPARWALPDAAWEGELRVQVDPPAPVVVRFSTGEEHRVVPLADGTFPSIRVPAGVDAATVEGPPGAGASVSMRTLLAPTIDARPAPQAESEEVLATLSRLTTEIDAGASPLPRALLLASVGQLSAARRDLARVQPRTAAEAVYLRALWDDIAPVVPSAPAPGPRTVEAALAIAGVDVQAPADADALEELARRTDSTFLWSAAAEAWLAADDVVRASWAASQPEVPDPDTLAAIEARTRWSSLSLPDAAAGVGKVPVARRAAQPGWWRQVRDALLGSPWPADEAMVVRGGATNVVKVDGAAIRVEIFCRDESGAGTPCATTVHADGTGGALRLDDGEQAVRSFGLGAGRHDVEVAGPGAGHALVVRTSADGAVVPPARSRRTLLARPGRPVVVTIGAPGLLRVSAVRGAARCAGVDVREGALPRILALREGPRQTVRCEGDADLLVDTGGLEPPGPPTPPPVEAPTPAPALPDTELRPAIEALIPRTPPPLRVPGDEGTLRTALSYHHESVSAPDRTWDVAELSLGWLSAGPRAWLDSEAWMRGPAPAAGGRVQVGLIWPDGHASAEVRAGYAVPVPGGGGRAISGQLQLRGRQDLPLSPSNTLRFDARLRGGVWSEPADGRVDLRAWTRWDADHPFFAELTAGWEGNPTTDLAFDLNLRATSNSFGDDVVLDAIGPEASMDLLVGKAVVLGLDVSMRHKLADAHRFAPYWLPQAFVDGRWGVWDRGWRLWEVWAAAGVVQTSPEVHAGLRVYWTGGRGLHDLPPDSFPFRTARDLP